MSNILIDPIRHTLYVSNKNVTISALMTAASSTRSKQRIWKVSYKNVVIGSVRIKNDYATPNDCEL